MSYQLSAIASWRQCELSMQAGQHGANELSLCMILHDPYRDEPGEPARAEVFLGDGDAVLMTSEEAAWTFTSLSSVNVAGLRMPRSGHRSSRHG